MLLQRTINVLLLVLYFTIFVGSAFSQEELSEENNYEKSPPLQEFIKEDFDEDNLYGELVSFTGRDAEVEFKNVVEDNRTCLRMKYKVTSFNWDENFLTVQEKFDDHVSFELYEGVNLWIKSDGNGGAFNLALIDKNNNVWEYSQNIILSTKGRWIKLFIPFSLGRIRTTMYSKGDFNWKEIKTLSFGVSLPNRGLFRDLPFMGEIFIDKIELEKRGGFLKRSILNYLPNGYIMLEYYTDKEMPIIKDTSKKDYGFYITYNWQDKLFFAEQFSLNWKVAIPTHYTILGKDLKQKGEVYRIGYSDKKDEEAQRLRIGIKEAYLLYAPYTIPIIKRLRLGTQNFKWSDMSVFSTEQMLGLYWQGVNKQTTMDAFLMGNVRNDKYFTGLRIAPQLNSQWRFLADYVFGLMYIKKLSEQGEALNSRIIGQDYNLYSLEIKGEQDRFLFLNNAKVYGGYSSTVEKQYGGITQLQDGSERFVFINSWLTPFVIQGDFWRVGTELNYKVLKLGMEYRYISENYGGLGYRAELLRWANDPKAELLMTERRREISFIQWKYRRLTRTTYDNQKGFLLNSALDFDQYGILEYAGDYSSTITSEDVNENRLLLGYSLPMKWITPMLWWRWEKSFDKKDVVLFDTKYYEIGLTSVPIKFIQVTGAFQYSQDAIDSIHQNVYFGEIFSDILHNISLQFRIKYSDPQLTNEDLTGLVGTFRHDDIRESIDHMPDTYIQLLMRIEI